MRTIRETEDFITTSTDHPERLRELTRAEILQLDPLRWDINFLLGEPDPPRPEAENDEEFKRFLAGE
jgi:hypothetical protein